jgi:predicted XRE-type DNA-binding protein
MPKSLNELKKKISPAVLRNAEKKTKKMLAEFPLQEVRHARKLSQEQIAETLHIKQASVSKLERRTDMYISTLRNFIRAMGGELEINAVFPNGAIKIMMFGSLENQL